MPQLLFLYLIHNSVKVLHEDTKNHFRSIFNTSNNKIKGEDVAYDNIIVEHMIK